MATLAIFADDLVSKPEDGVDDVPEDGLDDFEFARYLEDKGHLKRSHSMPIAFKNQISSMVGKALSMCQSVVEKSSQVTTAFTHELTDGSCAVDAMETARSLLCKVQTDYDEFRSIVTGGAADGWYPACSPESSPVSSPGLSPCSCLKAIQCSFSVLPVSVAVPTGAATPSQLVVPRLACGVGNGVGNVVTVPHCSDALAVGDLPPPQVAARTRLRSTAALFKPAIQDNTRVDTPKDMPAIALPRTTLMLRNLPNKLSRSSVMAVLACEGFANHVAFIYVPMNLRSSGNFGYAFVDFDSTKVAEQCKQKLDGFTGWSEACEKALEVAWSETQGLDAHMWRYRDSPLMHESVEDELKPAMFKNGIRMAFPLPTKIIRPPRLRKATEQSKQESAY